MTPQKPGTSCHCCYIASSALLVTLIWSCLIMACPCVQAQTFTVLHSFAVNDGSSPYAGVIIDRAGNLYGTTRYGGNHGYGLVYKLSHSGSSWIENPLYSFQGMNLNDGAYPYARVVFGPDGSLYGTTADGGTPSFSCPNGCGTVFRLTPPAHTCQNVLCPWTETILHQFQDSPDGANPGYGDLIFDLQHNAYGTTTIGGGGGCNDLSCGTVFELSHATGNWVENVILTFGGDEGYWPRSGVIFDGAGNLYGTSGLNFSSVYELTPGDQGWSESTLYTFTDAENAYGGLLFDESGNLYGTTANRGSGGGGQVFELSPANGSWLLTTLYAFTYSGTNVTPGPTSTLTADAAGNLYGSTTAVGAFGYGSVFELVRSNGGWTYSDLYDFTGGNDGAYPHGQVALDANNNIYGTTANGGTHGEGVVFQITR